MQLLFDYNNVSIESSEIIDELAGRKDFVFTYGDCFCGCAEYSVLSTTTRHRNQFTIVSCSRCGTLRINPYLTETALDTYYKEVYGPVKRKGISPDGLYLYQAKFSEGLFATLSSEVSSTTRMLDFGAGAGGRLDRFHGVVKSIHILEPDTRYAEFAIAKGCFPVVEGERYDFAVLSHVLEHVLDPVGLLTHLRETLIEADGRLYVEVPLTRPKSKLLKQFHIAHKWYFTRESLTACAGAAGYEVVRQAKDGLILRPTGLKPAPEEVIKLLATSRDVIAQAVARERREKRRDALKRLLNPGRWVR